MAVWGRPGEGNQNPVPSQFNLNSSGSLKPPHREGRRVGGSFCRRTLIVVCQRSGWEDRWGQREQSSPPPPAMDLSLGSVASKGRQGSDISLVAFCLSWGCFEELAPKCPSSTHTAKHLNPSPARPPGGPWTSHHLAPSLTSAGGGVRLRDLSPLTLCSADSTGHSESKTQPNSTSEAQSPPWWPRTRPGQARSDTPRLPPPPTPSPVPFSLLSSKALLLQL